jgi:hypothetical protein
MGHYPCRLRKGKQVPSPSIEQDRNRIDLALVFFGGEQDTAAYARQRDELIFSLVKEEFPDIKVILKHGHNLHDPEEVVKKGNGGKAITTLTSWKKVSRFC